MEKELTLLEIIKKYDLNKDRSSGTDKIRNHSYIDIYENIFKKRKYDVLTILEIGTLFGGSGLLWHKYFVNSKIILLDIQDRTIRKHMSQFDKNKYEKIVANAYSDEMVNTIKQKYPEGIDIAIDDGPHTIQSQLDFIRLYMPLINKNGLLIIEDIKTLEHANTIKDSLPNKDKALIYDLRHVKDRYDDIMLVVNL